MRFFHSIEPAAGLATAVVCSAARSPFRPAPVWVFLNRGRRRQAALICNPADRRAARRRAARSKERAGSAARTAGSYTAEFEETIIEPLTDEQFALEDVVVQTPAATLVGAAVKLRWLAHEIVIMTGDEDDVARVCCRQVLAVIERELGQALPASRPRPTNPRCRVTPGN